MWSLQLEWRKCKDWMNRNAIFLSKFAEIA
jgi:hypothetical protein